MSNYIIGRKMTRFELVVTTFMCAFYSAAFAAVALFVPICMANVGKHMTQSGNDVLGWSLLSLSVAFGVWSGAKWYQREAA